ncbi:hypothetical protein ACFFX0_32960 [Citricoccus parietis]|uniref:Uncharacterized protein n=1 Tax=Citricoccus parietis TaxID=592307 RepID=A0ABV5GB71_9MICC
MAHHRHDGLSGHDLLHLLRLARPILRERGIDGGAAGGIVAFSIILQMSGSLLARSGRRGCVRSRG